MLGTAAAAAAALSAWARRVAPRAIHGVELSALASSDRALAPAAFMVRARQGRRRRWIRGQDADADQAKFDVGQEFRFWISHVLQRGAARSGVKSRLPAEVTPEEPEQSSPEEAATTEKALGALPRSAMVLASLAL